MKRALVVLVLASCRYHATNVEDLSAQCETHCATVHQRCVQNGEAAKLGLPGITYDLCRRELEACQRDCRPMTAPLVTGTPRDDTPTDGVLWNPSTRELSCAHSALRVTLTDEAAQALTRGGADAVFINLAPDSVLLVRGGDKPFPPLLDDWAMLHAQLTGQGDAKLEGQFDAQLSGSDAAWSGSSDGFHVSARMQPHCRWLTIERDGAQRRAAAAASW